MAELKLTVEKGSFAIFNRKRVYAGTVEVGTLFINRKRAWSADRNTYQFQPNDKGKELGFTLQIADTIKQTLWRVTTYRETRLEAPSVIASRLVRIMELDNGSHFKVTERQQAELVEAIGFMLADGFVATTGHLEAALETIAAGDQDEAAAKYGKIKGYDALNRALESIFNGEVD